MYQHVRKCNHSLVKPAIFGGDGPRQASPRVIEGAAQRLILAVALADRHGNESRRCKRVAGTVCDNTWRHTSSSLACLVDVGRRRHRDIL